MLYLVVSPMSSFPLYYVFQTILGTFQQMNTFKHGTNKLTVSSYIDGINNKTIANVKTEQCEGVCACVLGEGGFFGLE